MLRRLRHADVLGALTSIVMLHRGSVIVGQARIAARPKRVLNRMKFEHVLADRMAGRTDWPPVRACVAVCDVRPTMCDFARIFGWRTDDADRVAKSEQMQRCSGLRTRSSMGHGACHASRARARRESECARFLSIARACACHACVRVPISHFGARKLEAYVRPSPPGERGGDLEN